MAKAQQRMQQMLVAAVAATAIIFLLKRARFKDRCYFRINTVDESAFIGARRSAHDEGKPTF
jgi:hypothetical protein